jgi:DNA-binding response OmpR family regulator/7-cyano-7-deazaguanine synthase in queuosine biosynthesis
MANEHVILCGHAALSSRERVWRDAPQLRLRLGKGKADVHLNIDRLSRQLCAGLPAVAIDLLELASYLYAADQATPRGGTREFDYGQRWRRHFRFEVPVRRPEVWSRRDVAVPLAETLGFLADETYEFAFVRHRNPPLMDGYLFQEAGPGEAEGVEEVMLFSGGLDSLGGAVQEVLQGRRKVALVSHRPVNKLYARQRRLAAAIASRVAEARLKPIHVAIEVNKGKPLGIEFTQRTRSFLFAAFAAVVASVFRLPRVRFYENGVISLNLPISPQVLGGWATRTTHPRVLNGFQQLFSALFEGAFHVENPFLWKTKAQILTEIKAAGHGDLCALAGSCTHTIATTKTQSHCGRCSQCVDRRLNALAARLDRAEDPEEIYASDVLTGAREGAELTLIERYLGTARRVERMRTPAEFLAEFAEASRVLRQLRVTPDRAVQLIFDLHKRHARGITEALAAAVRAGSDDLIRRNLPTNCLLRLSLGAAVRPTPADGNGAGAARYPRTFVLDPDTFEARFADKACFLGNTNEYRLLERLLRRPGVFVSVDSLRDDVWGDSQVEKNTIQRTVSNLRRKLRKSHMEAVTIDGSQRGCYRLVIGS